MVFRCRVCGYIFDESEGKSFSELTECPTCKMGPDAFECIDDGHIGKGDSGEKVTRIAVYVQKAGAGKVHNVVRAISEQCKEKAIQIYGKNSEVYFYTDIGHYDMTSLDRPFLMKLMKDITDGKIDVVMLPKLAMIGSEIEVVLAFYKFLKDRKVEIATLNDGKKVAPLLDKAMEK